MSAYRAVIFDLDGTLLDSLADIADSLNKVLAEMGLPTHSRDAYRYMVGAGMETLVQRALPPSRQDQATETRALAAMRREYERNWCRQTRPYPEIPDLLAALKQRGIAMAVLSNKPEDFTRKSVAALLEPEYFRVVRGARPDTPKKPDPAGALALAAQLALPVEDFLYVGDSGIDMQTARAAGMFAVGVLWGFRSKAELAESGAAALIGRPLELLELLEEIR